jgi:hypothetical protein
MPYKVVPFVTDLRSKDAPRRISEQFEALTNTMEHEGWGYVRLEGVQAVVNKGCLSWLMGSPVEAIHVYAAVFHKD